VALRWLGYVDLGTKFEDFFDSDFTLAARFMPQYGHTYRGPIFGSADGTFIVGQGNYEEDTRNGCHYHMAASNRDVPSGNTNVVTIPFGFWAYDVCNENCAEEANWSFVWFGTPKHGQYVRKAQ
jgi:hypothetical protein